jgi:hypothetical protein
VAPQVEVRGDVGRRLLIIFLFLWQMVWMAAIGEAGTYRSTASALAFPSFRIVLTRSLTRPNILVIWFGWFRDAHRERRDDRFAHLQSV